MNNILLDKEYRIALDYLQKGGVVLLPTDTVYGLGAMPTHENAVNRIFQLKDRPAKQHLPIMLHGIEAIEALNLEINPTAEKMLHSEHMPGDVTLILGFKNDERKAWLEGREEVAVRIPDDEKLRALLEAVGPVLMTSANRHGMDTPDSVKGIYEQLEGLPDYFIDGGLRTKSASTIINCRENPTSIIRSGRIGEEELKRILR